MKKKVQVNTNTNRIKIQIVTWLEFMIKKIRLHYK